MKYDKDITKIKKSEHSETQWISCC